MISLLISTILGGLILLIHSQRLIMDKLYHQELAEDNTLSALNWFLETDEDGIGEYKGVLFGTATDSFHVQAAYWGMYSLVNVRAKHGRAEHHRSCLVGAKPQDVSNAALFLDDTHFPLKLVGKCELKGTCYLPKAGVKSGHIGRRTFEGRMLVDGEVKESLYTSWPFQYTAFLDAQRDLMEVYTGQLGDVPINSSPIPEWHLPAHQYNSMEGILLDQQTFIGKYKIKSSEYVYIRANTRIEGGIIIAPIIEVEQGFQGNVQLFATDTLIIQPKVHLRYPSAIVLSSPDEKKPGYIQIGEGTTVEGVVLNSTEFLGLTESDKAFTRLGKQTRVLGEVICKGRTELRGEVLGSLFTHTFYLQTLGSVYGNYLLDARISRADLTNDYVSSMHISTPTLTVAQWL